jgi:hypothetical protein
MVHLSPSPESFELNLVEKGRSPGSLSCRLPAPILGTVAWMDKILFMRTAYSCGDSFGFAPNSHLIPSPKGDWEPDSAANIAYFLQKKKKERNCFPA